MHRRYKFDACWRFDASEWREMTSPELPGGRWTRLVVRPDALVRFWCIGGLKAGPAYAAISGASVFEDAAFTSHVFLSDGSTHVRRDEISDLYDRFVQAMDDDRTVPQRLAKHYVAQGEAWVRECEAQLASTERLRTLDDSGLAALLSLYCDMYTEYAPALYLPFPVERLYTERFPDLLERISEKVARALEKRVRQADETVAKYLDGGLLSIADTAEMAARIQPLIETAPLRTDAEQKDEALTALAKRLGEELGSAAPPPNPEGLSSLSPELDAALDEIEAKYGWIGQWGYPPRYQASTKADLWQEALIRFERLAEGNQQERGTWTEDDIAKLLDDADISDDDRMLVSDFAYYNFYRTRRMELLIRAQYLSVPLFEEIGHRLGIDSSEWANLTPDELGSCLNGELPAPGLKERSAERAQGWMLYSDGLGDVRVIWEGEDYWDRFGSFTAVLRSGENARGAVDASDPAMVGGKAAALAQLATGGFAVPDYVVLTTAATAEITERGADSVAGRALRDAVEELDGKGNLAVRSSATVEDGDAHSWAGRFQSVLGVTSSDLFEAVTTVAASARTERVDKYAEQIGVPADEIAMAVIVQRQVDAEFAGVINTSVGTEEGSAIEMEVVTGLGDKLVDGSTTPARWLMLDDGRALRSGADTINVDDGLIKELAELARRIEAFFSQPQDVEFAIRDGKVHVVQSRPLTGRFGGTERPENESLDGFAEVVSGLSGHVSKRVTGTVVMPERPGDVGRLDPGSILVLRAATPIWDTVVFQAKALVTDEGGSTSHAIRVANELEIPAVVGTRIATSSLSPGEEIMVDTTGGTSTGRVLRRR
jgi:pyruvate,water dikinase